MCSHVNVNMQPPRGWQIALLVVLAVVLVGVSSTIGALSSVRSSRNWRRARPASAPPAVVFQIVWPVLYLLAAGGLWFIVVSPKAVSPGIRWTSVALLSAVLVLSFAWTPVFTKGTASASRAATWMIVAMLMLALPGIVLAAATSPVAAALWAPWLGWLTFALTMSNETTRLLLAREQQLERHSGPRLKPPASA